jgi:hypothetical protein
MIRVKEGVLSFVSEKESHTFAPLLENRVADGPIVKTLLSASVGMRYKALPYGRKERRTCCKSRRNKVSP